MRPDGFSRTGARRYPATAARDNLPTIMFFGGHIMPRLAFPRRWVLALLAVLALAGCARDPLAVDALTLAPPVPADRSRLVIYTDGLMDALSRGDVFVNRRRIGPVEGWGVLTVDVDPGTQIVSVNTQLGYASAIETMPGEMVYIHLTAPLLGEWAGEYVALRVPDDVGQEAIRGLRMSHMN